MAGRILINDVDPRDAWGMYINAVAGREPLAQKLETLDAGASRHGAIMLSRKPKMEARTLVLAAGDGGGMIGKSYTDLISRIDAFIRFLSTNRNNIEVSFDDHPGRRVRGYLRSDPLDWRGAWGAKLYVPFTLTVFCPDPFFVEGPHTDPNITLATGTSFKIVGGDVDTDLQISINGGAGGITTAVEFSLTDGRRLLIHPFAPDGVAIPANQSLVINTETQAVYFTGTPTVSRHSNIVIDPTPHVHPHEFRAAPGEDRITVVQGVAGRTWTLVRTPRWTFA